MKANKIIILSVCAAIVVVATAGASFWFLRTEKKPKQMDFLGQTPDQIRAYLRSKDFNSLDEQTRRAARRSAFGQIMDYQVNEYFSTPAEKQTAYLDKIINEMETRRREFVPRRRDPNDPNRPQRQQFARGAENMRARMESVKPLERAQRQAFREALRQRMQQRGIRGGGGGRGRG